MVKHQSCVGETRVVGGSLTGEKLGVIVIGIDGEEPGVITSSCGGEYRIDITAILLGINLDLSDLQESYYAETCDGMNTRCTVSNGAVVRASNSRLRECRIVTVLLV